MPAEAAPYGSHSRASCSLRLASQWAADTFKSEKFEDAAEFGRIGRYYATESMLVRDPETGRYDAAATPSTGTETLADFYARLVAGTATVERGDHAVF